MPSISQRTYNQLVAGRQNVHTNNRLDEISLNTSNPLLSKTIHFHTLLPNQTAYSDVVDTTAITPNYTFQVAGIVSNVDVKFHVGVSNNGQDFYEYNHIAFITHSNLDISAEFKMCFRYFQFGVKNRTAENQSARLSYSGKC